ncbi:uncharacterized protein LOC116128410 isoform X4 [Pistacia vera]|uniref:uncharacterized protein LOC116128410 isoform X4 n=1 Tax=Pistacia vera TaxID=55513 RepID=UPI001263A1B3|nr:uncharacterized protein LOC116128410 isoform X4 [Pistacia vera]
MNKKDRVTPDWTKAPPDVLEAIAKRLHARIELLRFRAVCSSFRSGLPRPPSVLFPDSILKKTDFLKGPIPREDYQFVLVESPIYVVEPIDNINHNQIWFVEVQEVTPVAGPREDLKNAILFLVESLNDLFLVAQFSSEGIHCFKVFKLNEETHEWDLVEDELELEDRVFFDVECNPFSVSASEFPALRGNCIYFFNYDFREYEDLDIEDVRIYDLRTHTDSKLADFRGFSTLFWPPPAWLKQRSFRSAGLLRN